MLIEGWVLWTLLAAVMQSVRTAGQKYLTVDISAFAATMVRYLFGLPFALLYFVLLASGREFELPPLNTTFLICGLLAGVLQIIATVLLVNLFTMRKFAVGSTYAKTEVILTAIIGFFFFTETISMPGWVAIVICVAGVITINLARTGALNSLWNRSAIYGLGAGFSFALTSLLIRRASLSFGVDDFVLTASMTLFYMVVVQTIMTVVWIAWTDRAQFRKVMVKWRPSLFVGVTSVIGSVGWFTAMTLELASYVKTLGQVEFLITFAIGWYYFRERPTIAEIVGMLLIMTSVIMLLVYT